MAQKVQIHHESRLFDFVYDPTYALTSRDFVKADNLARHHFLSARQSKSKTTDLDGLLTVRPLFTTDHREISSSDTNLNNCQSVVVEGRQSPRYVSSVNRPVSFGDRHKPVALSKPLLYTPVQTPVLQDDRRTSMRTDLESSLRSSSSGYHSVRSQNVPTSAKVQAIIERLYHGHQPGRPCTRCSYGWQTDENGHSTSPQSPSLLPQVNAKDVELVESMRAKRSLGRHTEECSRSMESVNKSSQLVSPTNSMISSGGRKINSSPRRFASSPSRENRNADYLRQKLAIHTENLRKDIEEKLKRMRVSHERALQRLENEHKPRSRDRLSMKLSVENLYAQPQLKQKRRTKSKKEETTEEKLNKDEISIENDNLTNIAQSETNQVISVYQQSSESVLNETGTQTDDTKLFQEDENSVEFTDLEKNPDPETYIESVVDARTVQDDIIKPLVDFIISESIISVANFRASEQIAIAVTAGRKSTSLIKDVNEFFSKDLLPSSINLVQQLLQTETRM